MISVTGTLTRVPATATALLRLSRATGKASGSDRPATVTVAATRRVSGGVDALIERVTGSTHGADEILVAAFVQRLAQAADMDVDGAQLDLGIAAPHRIEQLLAREDAAGPLEEEAQQAELRRAEMDRLAGAADAMRREIEREIAEAQDFGIARRAGAADHGPEPRDQLARAEGLRDIIVGAAVEAAHAV